METVNISEVVDKNVKYVAVNADGKIVMTWAAARLGTKKSFIFEMNAEMNQWTIKKVVG